MDKVDLRCVGGPFNGQYFPVPSLAHGDPITLYGGGTAPNPTEYTAFKVQFCGPVSAIRGTFMVLIHTGRDSRGTDIDDLTTLLEHDVTSPRIKILFPVE